MNPLAVQPHLKKLFEAIDHLDFEPYQPDPGEYVPLGVGTHLHNFVITAMSSLEGERVPFDQTMRPSTQVRERACALRSDHAAVHSGVRASVCPSIRSRSRPPR